MSSDLTHRNHAVALAMCQMMLTTQGTRSGGTVTFQDVTDAVSQVSSMKSLAGLDVDRLTRDLQERLTVYTPAHRTLGSDDGHVPWLPRRAPDIHWRYWERYCLYLNERVPPSAVNSVDDITRDVLARIEDPERAGPWDRRGLVMGHVQSGKTANYCGLACKALDAGYRVVIVLAGIHNSLRSQTQVRLEEGLLGFMSDVTGGGQQTFKPVGVGLIDRSLRANTGTSRSQSGDFNLQVARQFGIHPGGLPLVFVVKKHVGVLDNLISWIRSCSDRHEEATDRKYVSNVAALVIDDEADLASVDTKSGVLNELNEPDPDHDPARTNKCIRKLLRCFDKVAYVGYTATPFANIYIHDKGYTQALGDDLFPRSFIVGIPPSSNYMGPARVFGLQEDEDAGIEEVPALPIIREVEDHADSDKVDETEGWMPPKLVARTGHIPLYQGERRIPPSLHEAVMAFLLATAVRRLREPIPQFNTMLVHVTRYTKVQKEVVAQVSAAIKEISQRLRNGDGARRPTIYEEFRTIYEDDFLKASKKVAGILQSTHELPPWESVSAGLVSVVAGVLVKEINGSAKDALDYEAHRDTGLTLVAVGGDKLSRGLTLEGLTVSYFLRSSRMYDTLMQMGRWFGYREKYIDVCRLYTTSELVRWFTHIAAASEELRREFEHMVNIGEDPKTYGLRVRSHPAMLVTSAVKMRHGTEMKLSFSGDVSETVIYARDHQWVAGNAEAVDSWLRSLGRPVSGGKKGGFLWTTDADGVLAFLSKYRSHPDALRADTKLLSRYITAQREIGELTHWTVVLVSSGLADATPYPRPIGGVVGGLVNRKPAPKGQTTKKCVMRRIVNPSDETYGLTRDQLDDALGRSIAAWTEDTRANKRITAPDSPSGRFCRQVRDEKHGLLLIYPMDPAYAEIEAETEPLCGIALSFPVSENAREISYTVNNVFTTVGGDDDSI
jgi:hypothetical protein